MASAGKTQAEINTVLAQDIRPTIANLNRTIAAAQQSAEALNGAIRGGQYDQVLNRWGESVERLAQSEINPPGLGD